MFIKGDAYLADHVGTDILRNLRKDDVIALLVRPDAGNEFVAAVKVTAVDVRQLLVRIEGFADHNGARANVIAQLFTTEDSPGSGAIEMTFYE